MILTLTEQHFISSNVAKGSFKYGTVFSLRNFIGLSHSMTDAPLDPSPENLRMWI